MDALGLEVQCAIACKTESETKAERKPKTATGGERVGSGKGAVRARNFAASNRRVGGPSSKKASRVVDPAFARPFASLLRHCFSSCATIKPFKVPNKASHCIFFLPRTI